MQSAALRPRTAPHAQQNPGEQQNLQTPKEKPAYPPPSNHVPIKEGEVRKSKASYRKGSIVAICFFAVLCLVSLGMLGYLLIPRLVAKSEYIALSPSAMSDRDDSFSFSDIGSLITSPEQEEGSQMLTSELLAYYEQINPDFIGWLDVPGTQIHYPIVRTTNNDYYLRHTFKKSYSDYGSIYADYRCADDLSDANTVIYGHNMRNGTMFHDLVNMLDEDYLQEHQTFTITTSDAQVMTYEIFSVHEVHVATDYRTITLDDYERAPYFETLQGYSDVDIPEVEFDEQSRIVTFSTCPNDSDDRYRIAVHAILVSVEPLEE